MVISCTNAYCSWSTAAPPVPVNLVVEPNISAGRYAVHAPMYIGSIVVESAVGLTPGAVLYRCRWVGGRRRFEATADDLREMGARLPVLTAPTPLPTSSVEL